MWNLKPRRLPNNCSALIPLAPRRGGGGCLLQAAGQSVEGMRGGVGTGKHAAFAARAVAGLGFWTYFCDLPPLSLPSSSSMCLLLLPPVSLCFPAPCSRLSLLCLSPGTAFGYFILFFQDLCRHCWFGLSPLCPQHGCSCSSSWLHVARAQKKSTSISVAGVTEDKRSLVMLQFFFTVLLGAARTPA